MSFFWFRRRRYRSMLFSEDAATRLNAARKLGDLGDPGDVGTLYWFLKRERISEVREALSEGLRRIGTQSFEPLLQILSNTRKNKRISPGEASRILAGAAYILGIVRDDRALALLIEALKDYDSQVCEAASQALGNLGNRQAAEVLVARVQDKSWFRLLPLIPSFGLSLVGTETKEYIRSVMDGEVSVRVAAVKALEKLGDGRGFEVLVRALKTEGHGQQDDIERILAAKALGLLGDERAREPLAQNMEGRCSRALREAIAEAIARLDYSHTGDT
ncbi:MAG: HEAT repeat domain-containing protein [Proteobacteria bacterium]|nr:HEAT repeat domain-containing protein [Pseudomonadota bacterium]